MKFKDVEKHVKEEINCEVEGLANDFLKSQLTTHKEAKKRFEQADEYYKSILEEEITQEFLASKGYRIADKDPYK